MPVRSSTRNNSALTGRIFIKFEHFRKSAEKIQGSLKSVTNNGYNIHEDQYIVLIILDEFFLEWEVFKSYRESQNTHFISISFSRKSCLCEIIWKNFVEPDMLQMTMWRMHLACSMSKATKILLIYVIFVAFPLEMWLYERASLLRYSALPVLFVLYLRIHLKPKHCFVKFCSTEKKKLYIMWTCSAVSKAVFIFMYKKPVF